MKNINEKIIDLEYLNTTCGGSKEMVRQIVQMFLDTTPQLINDLKKNILNQEWDLTKRNAHKAKSSFRMIGAFDVGNRLETIELRNTDHNSVLLNQIMEGIETSLETIYHELKNHINE